MAEHGRGRDRARQPPGLDQRLPDTDALERALAAWERPRNDARATITWRFTVTDARRKLKRTYPS